MKNAIAISILLVLFTSCKFTNSNIVEIDVIDIYNTTEENTQLGIDLISYDYSTPLMAKYPDIDLETLQQVIYSYRVTDKPERVTFNLTLKNEATKYTQEFQDFFTDFVQDKLEHYDDMKDVIAESLLTSEGIFDIMDQGDIDTIWKHTSSSLKNGTTKAKFGSILKKRNAEMTEPGERKINNRLLYDELGDGLEGSFIVLNYGNTNGISEQIIFDYINDSLQISGYRYFLSN